MSSCRIQDKLLLGVLLTNIHNNDYNLIITYIIRTVLNYTLHHQSLLLSLQLILFSPFKACTIIMANGFFTHWWISCQIDKFVTQWHYYVSETSEWNKNNRVLISQVQKSLTSLIVWCIGTLGALNVSANCCLSGTMQKQQRKEDVTDMVRIYWKYH